MKLWKVELMWQMQDKQLLMLFRKQLLKLVCLQKSLKLDYKLQVMHFKMH